MLKLGIHRALRMQAVLKAQINKTDRNDARSIAQMMRVGLYRPVQVKTLRGQKLQMLLTHRKLLQSRASMLYEAAQSMLLRSTKWSWLQGMGNANRQAARDEKGDRGVDTPVGRDHAPRLG
jgi:hypothetical protein